MPEQCALCIDEESLARPGLVGLDGERLERQPWLVLASQAAEARALASRRDVREFWVAGCDGVEPINLAAALKHDGAGRVVLISHAGGGSVRSRAAAAGIDEVLDAREFANRYAACKRALSQQAQGLSAADTGAMPVVVAGGSAESPLGQRNDAAQVGASRAAHAPLAFKAPAPAGQARLAPGMTGGRGLGKGVVLPVVGSSGGVGKSTVAALCAAQAQALGCRTVIVDADLQCGDIHYLMGQDEALRIDELMAAPARIESLAPEGGNPQVLAAPRALEESEAVAAGMPLLVNELRTRFDCVIVNTGAAWDDLHMELISQATNVLFVIDQRPTAIRAARHVLDLCLRCGVATQSFLYAVNRCGRGALFSSIDVSCALSGGHAVELADGGHVVEELLGTGQPLELIGMRNPLAMSIAKLLEPLLPVPEAAAPSSPQHEKKRRRKFGGRGKRVACL